MAKKPCKKWKSVAKRISPLVLEVWQRGYKEGHYLKSITLKEIYDSILQSYNEFEEIVKTRTEFEWGNCGILGLAKTYVPPEYWKYIEWRNGVWYITLEMIKKKKLGCAVEYKRVEKRDYCPTCKQVTKEYCPTYVRDRELPEEYEEICKKLKSETALI